MLDLGWSEILIIGVVALIVVGPKDLPKMLRTLGQYAGRARSIARDFQRSMDEAARQADIEELKDVKKDLNKMREAQYAMQREMSQSFLDKPSKPDSTKTGEKKTAAPEKGAGGAVEPSPESSTAPEPSSGAEPVSAEAAEPEAQPGKVSGA